MDPTAAAFSPSVEKTDYEYSGSGPCRAQTDLKPEISSDPSFLPLVEDPSPKPILSLSEASTIGDAVADLLKAKIDEIADAAKPPSPSPAEKCHDDCRNWIEDMESTVMDMQEKIADIHEDSKKQTKTLQELLSAVNQQCCALARLEQAVGIRPDDQIVPPSEVEAIKHDKKAMSEFLATWDKRFSQLEAKTEYPTKWAQEVTEEIERIRSSVKRAVDGAQLRITLAELVYEEMDGLNNRIGTLEAALVVDKESWRGNMRQPMGSSKKK